MLKRIQHPFQSARNDFQGARNKFQGAKSDFGSAKIDFQCAKIDFQGAATRGVSGVLSALINHHKEGKAHRSHDERLALRHLGRMLKKSAYGEREKNGSICI